MSTYREQVLLRACGKLCGKWTTEGKGNVLLKYPRRRLALTTENVLAFS